jgi:hypothetical protein
MLSAHAPTEDKDEMEKEECYVFLSKTCDQTPKHDMLIIIGHFNAKIGKEHHIARIARFRTFFGEGNAERERERDHQTHTNRKEQNELNGT